MHKARRIRNHLICSLLFILLIMSVSYAAFSSNLDIKGSTKVTSNWDVRVTSVVKGTFTGSAEEATVDGIKVNPQCSEAGTPKLCEDNLSVSINVDLFDIGDSAEYDVTVSNKGTIDAKLDDVLIDDSNNNSAVLITVSGYSPGQKLYKNGSSGSSMVIHVKVEYNPDYTGEPTSGEINLGFNYVQDDGSDAPVVTRSLLYDYQTNGGSKENESYSYEVNKNVDLSLMDDTRDGYNFVGWNTYKNAKVGLSSYLMPNNNSTLYAIYSKKVNVSYTKGYKISEIGEDSGSCTMYNKSAYCSVTLPSITALDHFNVDGWFDGDSKVGEANGTYNAREDVTLTAKAEIPKSYTITFNPDGGEVSTSSMTVPSGEAVGELPVASKSGFVFGGWYLSSTEIMEEDYVPGDDIEVTAKWYEEDKVAVMDGVGYTTLSAAIDNVLTDNNVKRIRLLKDVVEGKTIPKDKNIILNLDGHNINQDGTTKVFINNGALEIRNGSLSMTGTTNVIENNGVMKIKNCTITSSASSGAVDNHANGDLVIIDTRIEMTGSRQAIYNNGGKLIIKGSSYLSNIKDRAALHNLGNGVVTIESGKIVSTSSIGAIYNQEGTITIGKKDGIIDNDSIVIQGSSYGLAAAGNVKIYDGIIKGIKGALNNPSESVFTEVEDDTEPVNGIETIDGSTYKTLYLCHIGGTVVVSLNANGGDVEISQIRVQNGDAIGDLPVPTRNLYSFVGWYTGVSDGVQVTSTYVVDNDITIYARWKKNPTYTITFDEVGGSIVEDMEIEQGSSIGKLPISNKTGLFLDGWYLEDTYNTRVTKYYVPKKDTKLYAKWVETTFTKVFEQVGECTFNGSSKSNITGDECLDYADKKYIDTGISLYSEENIDRDYEVGFEIVNYNAEDNLRQATIFNTKNEANGYPGVVFRRKDVDSNLEFASRKTSSNNQAFLLPDSDVTSFTIYRIDGEIYYSLNGGEKVFSNDLTQFNPIFDLTAWFGAAPVDGTAKSAQRIFTGTLKNMYIKLGTYQEEERYRVTYDTNGGDTIDPNYKEVVQDNAIGTLPIPTRENYVFKGWYTGIESGIEVTSDYIPNSDITLYARWISL